MRHHLVLVHSYTNFELNNSKFARVTQFREKFKITKNLNASIDFAQIQYQTSLIVFLIPEIQKHQISEVLT